MKKHLLLCLSLLLIGLASVSARQVTYLNVVTFNMLAPAFAHPSSYPPGSGPLLDTAQRGTVLRETVSRLSGDVFQDRRFLQADVFALQEVQPSTLAALFVSGGLVDTEWLLFHVAHREDYWSRHHITDPEAIAEAPWTADRAGLGNALLIRRSTFDTASIDAFSAILNGEDGNRAPLFVGSVAGRPVRISSVHFDGHAGGRRRAELQSHLAQLVPVSGQVDIIAGDFNADTETGNLQQPLRRAGFLNALVTVGAKGRTRLGSTSNQSGGNGAAVDHVVARGASARESRIQNFGLFDRFPAKGGKGRDDNEDARVQAALGEIGSDHFPVVTRLAF